MSKTELPTVEEPRAERCETCRFVDDQFVVKFGDLYCMRFPPQVVVVKKNKMVTTWPDIDADDWCGEWQAKVPKGE